MGCQTAVCDCGCNFHDGATVSTGAVSRRKLRFIIGPGVNELILAYGRVNRVESPANGLTARIEISRNKCGDFPTTTFTSYATDSENKTIHFELSGEFLSDGEKFPRGFYKGKVFMYDCLVDEIEIIKSASFVISEVQAVSAKCKGDTDWIEPPCDGNEEMDQKCDNCSATTNGCPNCLTHTVIAERNIKEGYLTDLSGLDEEGDDGNA